MNKFVISLAAIGTAIALAGPAFATEPSTAAAVTDYQHKKVVVVEKKIYVDKPVYIEKKVYVDKPVYVEKIVEKPVYIEKKVFIEKPVYHKKADGYR